MKIKRNHDLLMKIDMTPMIDCTFLLLVFFMVGSTLHRLFPKDRGSWVSG